MAFLLCVCVTLYIAQSGAEEDRLGIVGGTEAKPHSLPYMASLQEGRRHLCGGILVAEDFVLTAAHCNGFRPYRVVLGAHSLHSPESTQQVLGVSHFYPHPKYKNKEKHDIMLLKGDSGGPLVCDGIAVGIVSFSGRHCGDNRFPDVYMYIPRYRRWIKRVLKRG